MKSLGIQEGKQGSYSRCELIFGYMKFPGANPPKGGIDFNGYIPYLLTSLKQDHEKTKCDLPEPASGRSTEL